VGSEELKKITKRASEGSDMHYEHVSGEKLLEGKVNVPAWCSTQDKRKGVDGSNNKGKSAEEKGEKCWSAFRGVSRGAQITI